MSQILSSGKELIQSKFLYARPWKQDNCLPYKIYLSLDKDISAFILFPSGEIKTTSDIFDPSTKKSNVSVHAVHQQEHS